MSTTLDAGEDRLIVDAFDRACAAYPRAYGGDAIVDGVAAGSDDSDDALLRRQRPRTPRRPSGCRRRRWATRTATSCARGTTRGTTPACTRRGNALLRRRVPIDTTCNTVNNS